MDVKIFQGIFSIIIILLLAPLFAGIVNKFKAIFTGRVGAPFYQPYFELLGYIKKDY
jgi:formate hydrogenlyase subunit 4